MKKLFGLAFLASALVVTACGDNSAAKKVDANNVQTSAADAAAAASEAPIMSFDKVMHDFGSIAEGERVQTVFSFTNTGKSDLVIVDARGSCGCTVPEWPREPIAPGETSEILVQFDSSNKSGNQSKRVTLTSNTNPAQTFLTIKGIVNKPEAAQ